MKVLRNKYFLFGNILLLLIAIPLTLFFIKRQQELRSRAQPSSTLSFTPASTTATKGQNFNIDVTIDPGQNLVSIVDMNIAFDFTKLEVVQITPNTAAFPLTIRGPIISSGSANISLGIGADVSRAIQATTKVATVTFAPLAPTADGPTRISFDPTQTRVFSLAAGDQPRENVLASTTPTTVTIQEGPAPSPTLTPTPTPSPTATVTPPVGGANAAPVCTDLSVSPGTTGVAPFSAMLTAKGSDSDGLITKVTFNFGDGKVQDVTPATSSASVTSQVSHTYQTAGSFSATAVFTDNKSAVSQACTRTVEVSAAQATPTPTPTARTTPTPTIESPGGITTTLGILGGIILTIVGGALLLGL